MKHALFPLVIFHCVFIRGKLTLSTCYQFFLISTRDNYFWSRHVLPSVKFHLKFTLSLFSQCQHFIGCDLAHLFSAPWQRNYCAYSQFGLCSPLSDSTVCTTHFAQERLNREDAIVFLSKLIMWRIKNLQTFMALIFCTSTFMGIVAWSELVNCSYFYSDQIHSIISFSCVM